MTDLSRLHCVGCGEVTLHKRGACIHCEPQEPHAPTISVPSQPRRERRPRGTLPKNCQQCGKQFLTDASAHARYCSSNCRNAGRLAERRSGGQPLARICAFCNTQFEVPYPSDPRQCCSRRCAAARRHRGQLKFMNGGYAHGPA